MSWLGTLWPLARRLPAWLWGAAAALGALLLAYLSGRGAGAAREHARQNEKALERRDTVDRIEREIGGLTPGELDERGEPWVRR